MNEQLLGAAWQQVCDNLLALRKSRVWRSSHASFNDYAAERWKLSKTRAKLYCDFSTFCAMCRDEFKPVPDCPDNVQPILGLAQKDWIYAYQLCLDKSKDENGFRFTEMTHKHILDTLSFYGIGIRRRVPEIVLKARKVRAAAKTMAEMGDGEKLVEDIGAAALGHDWDMAVAVTIDADQAKMNKK